MIDAAPPPVAAVLASPACNVAGPKCYYVFQQAVGQVCFRFGKGAPRPINPTCFVQNERGTWDRRPWLRVRQEAFRAMPGFTFM